MMSVSIRQYIEELEQNATNKREGEPMCRESCVDDGSMGATGKVEE